MNGQTDGHYQVHNLPVLLSYVVDNDTSPHSVSTAIQTFLYCQVIVMIKDPFSHISVTIGIINIAANVL